MRTDSWKRVSLSCGLSCVTSGGITSGVNDVTTAAAAVECQCILIAHLPPPDIDSAHYTDH